MKNLLLWLTITAALLFSSSCTYRNPSAVEHKLPTEIITSNLQVTGTALQIEFYKGPAHNHPTFAIWTEDLEGNFLQTLFVTRYLATGIFGYGELEPGKWKPEPGWNIRPAALPYWNHKRFGDPYAEPALPSPENPVPEAISGATPRSGFILQTKTDSPQNHKFRLLLEINQTWDWNDYWTNNKYPDDLNYKSSCQPAVVYAVTIDLDSNTKTYYMNPIGHSHYSGKDGNLYTDLSTLTTALQIVDKIIVKVK
jgi:hypothetical protein